MESKFGECTGKILSTPIPLEIFLTVKVELIPDPFLAIQIPLNICILSFSPSRTFTFIESVSPALNSGMSSLRDWAEARSNVLISFYSFVGDGLINIFYKDLVFVSLFFESVLLVSMLLSLSDVRS